MRNVLIMEVQKRRRCRPSTGRSEESLEAERLYRSAWYGSRVVFGLLKGFTKHGRFINIYEHEKPPD